MIGKWQLVSQAFRTWKQLDEARKRTSNTEEEERYQRLRSLSVIAWRRYSRRCRDAMFKSMRDALNTTRPVSGSQSETG